MTSPTAGSGGLKSSQAGDRRAMHQAEDLAKALGEACLLSDLSELLKFKQERQVHEAVLDSICSGKPSSCNVTPRMTSALVRPPPTSPGLVPKDHRWNRNPRLKPQKFSKVVFLNML